MTGFFCADFRLAQVSETTGPLSFSAIFLSFWAKSLSFLGKSIKFFTKFLSFDEIHWQFLQKFRLHFLQSVFALKVEFVYF